MNKFRRKLVKVLCDKLVQIHCEIVKITDEEQKCLDNIPENLSFSQIAENSKDSIVSLVSARYFLIDCIKELEYIVDNT